MAALTHQPSVERERERERERIAVYFTIGDENPMGGSGK
jgi:hypothetical protein